MPCQPLGAANCLSADQSLWDQHVLSIVHSPVMWEIATIILLMLGASSVYTLGGTHTCHTCVGAHMCGMCYTVHTQMWSHAYRTLGTLTCVNLMCRHLRNVCPQGSWRWPAHLRLHVLTQWHVVTVIRCQLTFTLHCIASCVHSTATMTLLCTRSASRNTCIWRRSLRELVWGKNWKECSLLLSHLPVLPLGATHWHCVTALILPTVALSNFAISTASGHARSSV